MDVAASKTVGAVLTDRAGKAIVNGCEHRKLKGKCKDCRGMGPEEGEEGTGHCVAASHLASSFSNYRQQSRGRKISRGQPRDQGQWGNCTIHAVVTCMESQLRDKYGILIDQDRAVYTFENAAHAADGAEVTDVLRVLSSSPQHWRVQHAKGGPKEQYILAVKYCKVQNYDSLLELMTHRDGQTQERAVVVMKLRASDKDSHAVAARGRWPSGGKIIAHNSWGASAPDLDVCRSNYCYHVELEFEIACTLRPSPHGRTTTWNRSPPPCFTPRSSPVLQTSVACSWATFVYASFPEGVL